MKIHYILQQVTTPGTIVTYSTIKENVLAQYPDIKPRSIIPSEHVQDKKGMCKICHIHPLFKKLGHGLYQVLSKPQPKPKLTIHQKLTEALKEYTHQLLSIEAIRQKVGEQFSDTHFASVIPVDHTLGGSCRLCTQTPLLERTKDRGIYRVLPPTTPPDLSQSPNELIPALQHLLQKYPIDKPNAHFLEELRALPGMTTLYFNLLSLALHSQVVQDLIDFGPLVKQNALYTRLSQRLHEQQGIVLPLAYWTVETWGQALNSLQHSSYPTFQETYKMAADSQYPTISLKHLRLILLTNQVYLLKKAHRRIAILAYPDTKRILGVQKSIASLLLKPLAAYCQTGLSTSLPLSSEEIASYTWYIFSSAEQLKNALNMLEQGFEPN